jgi:hypothetical protein
MAYIEVYDFCLAEGNGETSYCPGASHNRRACNHVGSIYVILHRASWAAHLKRESARRKRERKAKKRS